MFLWFLPVVILLLGRPASAGLARFEMKLGAAKVDYKEVHRTNTSSNIEFSEYVGTLKAFTEFYVISDWLFLGGEFEYLGHIFSSSRGERLRIYNQTAHAGITIPAKPFNITVIGEQFHSELKDNSSTFGMENVTGFKVYPLVHFGTQSGDHFFIKYPLVNTVSKREEYSLGATIRMSESSGEFPENIFQSGAIMTFEFQKVKQTITKAISVVDHQYSIISFYLGYNF